MTPKVKREIEAFVLAGDDGERAKRVEAIRAVYRPEPDPEPDPDFEAVRRAGEILETDPGEAERIVREHFAPAGAAWSTMTAGELETAQDGALDWLVDGLLPAGGTSLLLGTPKSGKSTMARVLASKVAAGMPWYARKVKAGAVVYVALDERRATVREHVWELVRFCPGPAADTMRERLRVAFGPRPDHPAAALAAMLSGIDPAPVLVVVDTLMKGFPFEDANDYGLTGESMAAVTDLAHGSGAHVMLVHHARKDSGDLTTAALGSTRLAADVDVLIGLRTDTNDKRRRLASFIGRDGVSEADINVSFADAGKVPNV